MLLLVRRRDATKRLLLNLIHDEPDNEALESALPTGFIAVSSISIVGAVGRKIQVLWAGTDAAL